MRLHKGHSPCRPHPCSVEHADVVYTFRLMQEDWERQAEDASRGYTTELAEYERDHPRPNLRDFLRQRRQT
jgi:hypothetical protein